MEKSPCKLNLLHCRQKTTTSLWNRNEKGIGETRKMRPQANSPQYNMQGWDIRGGGVKWGDSGRGGGGRLLCTNLYMSRVKWYDNTYFSTLIKKGLLLTVIRIRGTAETRRCDADAVRSQVITWNPALTLCASYLPLPPPPPAPPPLSQASVLIVTLVNPAHGIQGCPKVISFDKNYWHFNFRWVFFNLLFLCCFTPGHFSQHPLLKKMHSLFSTSR